MSAGPQAPQLKPPRNAANWAAPVKTIQVQDVPSGVTNLNLDGRVVVGPLQGFGRLWRLPIIPGLPGIIPIAAGVLVFYADDQSFRVMTLQGFPFRRGTPSARLYKGV